MWREEIRQQVTWLLKGLEKDGYIRVSTRIVTAYGHYNSLANDFATQDTRDRIALLKQELADRSDITVLQIEMTLLCYYPARELPKEIQDMIAKHFARCLIQPKDNGAFAMVRAALLKQ